MAKSKVDFSVLLDRTADQVARPVALPIGSYEALIKKFDLGESSQKSTPYVEVHFEILTVGEDVDPKEISSIESDVIGKVTKRKFYISTDAEYMLWEFLEEHIGLSSSGKNLKELLEESTLKKKKLAIKDEIYTMMQSCSQAVNH